MRDASALNTPMLKLTQEFVDSAKARQGMDRTRYWDADMPGFGLMVTAGGAKSFAVQYRVLGKRATKIMILRGDLKLKDARKEARALLGSVAKGHDPLADRRAERVKEIEKATDRAEGSLKAIVDEYFQREGKRLRTAHDRRRDLNRLVIPRLGKKQIVDITRKDIVDLLDDVEDKHDAAMATHILAHLRKIMNWYAARSDTFRSPIVRGMARIKPKQRRRKRILSDTELHAVWQAVEQLRSQAIVSTSKNKIALPVFAGLVQMILVTAGRRNEIAHAARRQIVDGDRLIIPPERYKTDMHLVLPLSAVASDLLAKLPKIGKAWLFTTDGKRKFSGFSKSKREFDKEVLRVLRKDDPDATLQRWTLHDLRRTARTLMSRAKAPQDIAERCIAHVQDDMVETYDCMSSLMKSATPSRHSAN
jgi:integrase